MFQFLLPLAKQLNRLPLPTFSQSYTHILLPPPNQMLGHVNYNLVPNRHPEASEGLYEGFEDDDEDGWGSEEYGSQDQQDEDGEDVPAEQASGAVGAGTVGEDDGDDVDGMDIAEDVKPNMNGNSSGSEERGQKRSIDETE